MLTLLKGGVRLVAALAQIVLIAPAWLITPVLGALIAGNTTCDQGCRKCWPRIAGSLVGCVGLILGGCFACFQVFADHKLVDNELVTTIATYWVAWLGLHAAAAIGYGIYKLGEAKMPDNPHAVPEQEAKASKLPEEA